MSEVALTFTVDGHGHGLYTEAIDLGQVGLLVIERATRIEFDNSMQYWRVYPLEGARALFSNPSRQACLEWEHRHIQTLEDITHEL